MNLENINLKKPITKDYILHDFVYSNVSAIGKSIDRK